MPGQHRAIVCPLPAAGSGWLPAVNGTRRGLVCTTSFPAAGEAGSWLKHASSSEVARGAVVGRTGVGRRENQVTECICGKAGFGSGSFRASVHGKMSVMGLER